MASSLESKPKPTAVALLLHRHIEPIKAETSRPRYLRPAQLTLSNPPKKKLIHLSAMRKFSVTLSLVTVIATLPRRVLNLPTCPRATLPITFSLMVSIKPLTVVRIRLNRWRRVLNLLRSLLRVRQHLYARLTRNLTNLLLRKSLSAVSTILVLTILRWMVPPL